MIHIAILLFFTWCYVQSEKKIIYKSSLISFFFKISWKVKLFEKLTREKPLTSTNPKGRAKIYLQIESARECPVSKSAEKILVVQKLNSLETRGIA